MPEVRKFPFRIGADPEFNFVVQNRQTGRLRAHDLMKEFFSDTRVGNSGFDIPGGNAGWDGASATGEIRPKPEYSPAGLTSNIGKIYKEICKRSPVAVKITVRSDTAPVGGHIHFELDDKSKHMSDASARIVQKRLSTFYIPIALGEDPTNMMLRLQTSYGKFNDWRRESGKTFEYRTPSAEWQLTPKICEATLAYLGTVWYEAVHKPQSFRKLDAVYANDRVGSSLQNMIVHKYPPLIRGVLSGLKSSIKNFEYYPMFKDEIDYILNYDKVLKDKQKSLFCVNMGWEFQENKQPTKKLINNEVQIRKGLRNIDIDRWLELFKIPYNADTNVKDYVDALKKRILAYDWNLKNEYYMFGLRKGIDKPIVMNGNYSILAGQDQIKTRRDHTAITDTFRRMRQRMERSFRSPAVQSIIIGLPYEKRLKRDTREIIDLIYDIEKNPEAYPPAVMKTSELVDDRESPIEEWGTIAQASHVQEAGLEVEAPQRSTTEFARMLTPDIDPNEDNDDEPNACPNCGAPNCDCDC